MAIKIQLGSSLVDVDLGGKIFEADISDKNVEKFTKAIATLENSFDKYEQSETEQEVYDLLTEDFRGVLAILFAENPCDYILEKVGRAVGLLDVVIDIREGITNELGNSTKQKIAKYSAKPKKKKR
ncbi:hypothetical protein [Carnobacterium jeotgali]|uniref:hypothetical protein n=1 Tax=Carnobacterium jeotgali TaxID=545534 RepID=UPI000493062B|nr:hypothetical protein [Carnobacterium jeotgali]